MLALVVQEVAGSSPARCCDKAASPGSEGQNYGCGHAADLPPVSVNKGV